MLDERFTDLGRTPFVIVQPPTLPTVRVQVRIVREHLPGLDGEAAAPVRHGVEGGMHRPDVRKDLRVQQDPLVVAQVLRHPPCLVHDPGRQGTARRFDGERREHEHVRVAA